MDFMQCIRHKEVSVKGYACRHLVYWYDVLLMLRKHNFKIH